MKRLAISLSIIVLLGVFFPFSILAQPIHTPHENPATAKGSLDTVALLFSYDDIFNLAAIRQYQDAQSLFSELEHAYIPAELQYIIDRYNALCRQLLTNLDTLESLLDEASTLLSRNQISDTKQKLDEAEATIHDAQSLLKDIEAATNTLGDKLGVFAASAASQIKQAYDRLEDSLRRLRQLINELNQLRQDLTDRYKTRVLELMPTELSLSLTPASVFVGDSITAWGRLSGDSPLPQRKLILLLDNKPLVITTDLDGSYQANITIPYKYVPNMTLNTEYIPSGDDIGTYTASKSLPVVVNTMFYPTLLEVSAPETAHPGLPITINGRVSSTGGNVDRTIRVLLDDIQMAKETIQGQFSLEVTLPRQTSTGEHSLTVVAAPQGRYSGASKSLTINISRLSIQTDIQTLQPAVIPLLLQADIQTPQLVIIPMPIQISGKVYHRLGPVQDARISLTFKDSSNTVTTATNGSFTTSLDAPLDLSLVGPQEIKITIKPVEPWYAPLEVKKRIFTVNPANTGLMLVALISLGLLVYNRGRIRPQEEKVSPQVRLAVTPAPEPTPKLTNIKSRILSAYTSGLEAVEKTSIPAAPHTTLREFLKTATPLSPTALKPFAELTTMAEVALYSAHWLDEDIATRAEYLAATIKEELHSGTS